MDTNTTSAATAQVAGDYLNEKQASDLIGVEPRTLKEWRSKKGFPFLRLSHKVVRFRRADIDEWMADHLTAIVA
jgi:excisionase family DNA binding protein